MTAPDAANTPPNRRYVTYPSGAIRADDTGKGHHELLSPFVDDLLAKHLERGAIPNSPRNWEKGMALSTYARRVRRHFGQGMMGMTDEDHFTAAYCNLHMLIHTREMIRMGVLPPELDDLPHYLKGTPWPSDASPRQSPTTSPSGAPASTPLAHAVRPACSNTPHQPSSWLRRTMARMGSTLTRWAWATP